MHEPTVTSRTRLFSWAQKGVLLVLTTVFIFLVTVWWFGEEPLTSPLSTLSSFSFLRAPRTSPHGNKIVYGFLPYWNLQKTTIQPELTELSYFGLTIGGDGSLLVREGENAEPGYHRLSSEDFLTLSQQVTKQGGSVEIVLSQFNADDIYSFLSNKKAHENLITSLDSVLLAYPITGVNIDIELNGSATPQLRNNLTEFMAELNQHLDSKYATIPLSIDMYASAAEGTQLWDPQGLAQHVDYIIVMAYDFHRRASPQAGPVAPLFGGKELWDHSINSYLQMFLEVVPPEKILLGVPFYGYEWQTTSRDARSHTFPDTGATASYERVQELLKRKDELKVQEHWNEEALSPYISYVEDGNIYVVYYENSRSISYKLDYVNQLDLAGIAIWALGYEGDSRELWDVIHRKITTL